MRRKEMVTFKATEKARKLAQKAHDIQDACNAFAVANFLLEVQQHYRSKESEQAEYGGDLGIQNPISIALVNKLNHLAGLEQSKTNCFIAILDLAEGKDVQWEIEFLA